MEQTMYCGSSLSRVGLDFRIMTHPIFEDCIRKMFVRRLEAAVFFFSESLRTHDWTIDTSAEPDPNDSAATIVNSESFQPSLTLLRHPPLALLANDLLDALNQLRYCAVLSIAGDLKQAIRSTLTNVTAALQAWGKMPSDSKQAHVYNDMLKELQDSLIPHIEQAQKILFAVKKEDDEKEAEAIKP
jgi:hypothetical protein